MKTEKNKKTKPKTEKKEKVAKKTTKTKITKAKTNKVKTAPKAKAKSRIKVANKIQKEQITTPNKYYDREDDLFYYKMVFDKQTNKNIELKIRKYDTVNYYKPNTRELFPANEAISHVNVAERSFIPEGSISIGEHNNILDFNSYPVKIRARYLIKKRILTCVNKVQRFIVGIIAPSILKQSEQQGYRFNYHVPNVYEKNKNNLGVKLSKNLSRKNHLTQNILK